MCGENIPFQVEISTFVLPTLSQFGRKTIYYRLAETTF